MWMRFQLQERVGDGRFRAVDAPGLGTWRKSHPGVRRFSHRQRVLDLAEGSAYRVVVTFRWYDADGDMQRSAQRTTRTCRQPDPRPNLTAAALAIQPAAEPGRRRYTATLVNTGRGAAGPFEVDFTREGALLGSVQIGGLAAGRQRSIAVPAVACTPGEQIAVVLDATHEVDESDETDNVLSVVC
jgi:hypothetical protein